MLNGATYNSTNDARHLKEKEKKNPVVKSKCDIETFNNK
jgi:hypothetical protein